LLLAIEAHRSGGSSSGDASEADTVIGQFDALPEIGNRTSSIFYAHFNGAAIVGARLAGSGRTAISSA